MSTGKKTIYIIFNGEKTITLKVDENVDITTLKEIIRKEFSITTPDIMLRYYRKILVDGKQLNDYKIDFNVPYFTIKTHNANRRANGRGSVQSKPAHVPQHEPEPEPEPEPATNEEREIYISNRGTDEMIILNIPTNALISTIKQGIYSKMKKKIPINEMILLHGGKKLDDALRLTDYEIKIQSTPDFTIRRKVVNRNNVRRVNGSKLKDIFVKILSENIKLHIKPDITILMIKEVITKRTGIEIKNQILSYAGKELKDDSLTLEDYNIDVVEDPQFTLMINNNGHNNNGHNNGHNNNGNMRILGRKTIWTGHNTQITNESVKQVYNKFCKNGIGNDEALKKKLYTNFDATTNNAKQEKIYGILMNIKMKDLQLKLQRMGYTYNAIQEYVSTNKFNTSDMVKTQVQKFMNNTAMGGKKSEKEYIKLQKGGKRLVRYGKLGGRYYMKGGQKRYISQ